MSYKAGGCYIVSIIGFVVSIIYVFKGMSVSSGDSYRAVSSIASASFYYIASFSFMFSFFAFIGARVVSYCDDSLAIKEQMLELVKTKIKNMTPWENKQ